MGIFDFASDISNKLTGNDDDPAETIEKHIVDDSAQGAPYLDYR